MSEILTEFTTDLESLDSIADLETVGRIYEIAINGVGYMLYDGNEDTENQDLVYRREVVPLDPERLATSDTPFSEAVQRYVFQSFSSFLAGAGQRHLYRDGSIDNAYLDSEGVDPFQRDGLSLLHSASRELATAHTAVRIAVVGDVLYAQTGDNDFTYVSTPGGSETGFSVAAATTIVDLATDGQSWYAAAGTASIFKGTTSDPGAKWDTLTAGTDVRVVEWAGQRICAAYVGPSGSTPNVFSTFTGAGAEEVASGRLVLPAGWTITSITDGNGYVFFGAYSGNVGVVYAWQVGSSDTPFLAWRLPPGHLPRAVRWYQGNVMVWATDDDRLVAYRAIPDTSGQLTPTFAFELTGYAGGYDVGEWAGDEALVFYPKSSASTKAGIGAFNLETGGYCNWLASSVAGLVRGVDRWQGRLVFSVDGDGVWSENPSTFVSTGWLETSIDDHGSTLDKVYDALTVVVDPLIADESLNVSYTTDGGASYTTWSDATMASAGLKRQTTDLSKKASSIGLKITLNGPGTSTPTMYSAQIRQHMHGLADQVVQWPIDCGDVVTDLKGRPLSENGPGKGAARARTLESLVQSRVVAQDRDWPATGTTDTWEIVSAQTRSRALFDRKAGKNVLRDVCVVTARRKFK
jgi:hypothetical protein